MKIDNFANRLKQAMEIRNMKQVDLVNKTGIDKAQISNYLAGKYSARQDSLTMLAKVLSTSETWLMGYDVPMNENFNNSILLDENPDLKLVQVPIYNQIPYGVPIEAVNEIIKYESIIVKQNDHKEYFGLVINDNSMLPDYKKDDIVIFIKQSSFKNSQECAIIINKTTTTFRRILTNENHIILQALNPDIDPIFCSNTDIEEGKVTILGVAYEIRRKVNKNKKS